ncbi:MAG: DNA polymerase IV [Firmicutes bacterium]|nr:DNA polymerase IV [Bacillota bacterium]
MSRWVLHVDMDAFFPSVEVLLDPRLAGKPVIVAGPAEERGVVASASYEARRYGVRSAMPTAQARRLCPHGVFLTGNRAAYAEYSRRVRDILERFTPLVEQTSIDEAYLDVTGCLPPGAGEDPDAEADAAVALAREIKGAVRRETGLPCSIGVAPNRLLAKMASREAKPDGVALFRLQDVPARLWPRPVEVIPGVGPSTAARLRALGVATVGDLAAFPVDVLSRELGVAGRQLHEAAWGRDPTPVPPAHLEPAAKSVSRETTFPMDVEDRDELERTLLGLSDDVARRLRRSRLAGRTVTVKVRWADFATVTRSHSLAEPTDLGEEVYREAREAFRAVWRAGRRVRLIGVTVSNLGPAESRDPGLFPGDDKRRRVSGAVDRIKDRFGEQALTRARLIRDGSANPETSAPGRKRRPRGTGRRAGGRASDT